MILVTTASLLLIQAAILFELKCVHIAHALLMSWLQECNHKISEKVSLS